jgi:hypothetical protein
MNQKKSRWMTGLGVMGVSCGLLGGAVDFNRDIQPILSEHCWACHGPDEATRKGRLRLDTEDGAKAEVVVPGRPEESELIARVVTGDSIDLMPPPEAGKERLSAEQVALLEQWIREGAPWAKHWAFERVRRPVLPEVGHAGWVRNEVDRFVLARLEAEGLLPQPEADRETLIRRVTLDLTGLPPTPEEVDAFLLDNSAEAYERVVDRLLGAERYGERMAMDWLDGARYADSNGYQNDFGRDMWPWRDWVIGAFNENMPFDRFAVEQLAGDLLPNPGKSQLVATGFNRNNHSVTEGGSIEEEWYVENRVDRVETTSTVFLGLTMGCARCHDHKYDPISAREFYEFYAFFNSTEDRGFYEEQRGNTGPTVELPTEENERELAAFEERIEAARREAEAYAGRRESELASLREGLAEVEGVELADPVFLEVAGGVLRDGSHYAGEGEMVWAEGLVGKALVLDGGEASYVDADLGGVFGRDRAFAVTAWVRPESHGTVFSKMEGAPGYRGVDTLIMEDGKLAVHILSTYSEDALKVESVLSRVKMGVWSHLGVSYDGSGKAAGVQVTLNGELVEMRTVLDSLKGEIGVERLFRIGRRAEERSLKGQVAEVRVFDRALRPEESQAWVARDLARAVELGGDGVERALAEYLGGVIEGRLAVKREVVEGLKRERDAYRRDKVPTVMVMRELAEARPTYRLVRGVYDAQDKREVLGPGVPAALPPMPGNSPRNRLGLARWIVSPENPLTSRVTVNRLWAKFFGSGLVKSLDNFGTQSAPPSHPGLLDWLASSFMESGWDLKAVQKSMVMSATYRQSSVVPAEAYEADPGNVMLARGPRFRVQAEVVRDTALAVSGLLVEKIGGPPVKPYQPAGLWEELAGGASQGPYVQSKGDDLYRRSLYINRKRTVSPPMLATFDAPGWEICTVKRPRTNTPLQALALLNDVAYVEASRHLGRRMQLAAGGDVLAGLRHGFRLVTGRWPGGAEEELLRSGYEGYLGVYGEDTEAAKEFLSHGESEVEWGEAPAELAAYTAVASVLMNLDETLTKN